jgi:uncharacterized Zn finger protein (UPF0148 family)
MTMAPQVHCPACGAPLTLALYTVTCVVCGDEDPTGEFDTPDPVDL